MEQKWNNMKMHVYVLSSMLIYEFLCWIWSAGKGFVEAVKNKTEEELDEEVRMESEAVQVKPSRLIH